MFLEKLAQEEQEIVKTMQEIEFLKNNKLDDLELQTELITDIIKKEEEAYKLGHHILSTYLLAKAIIINEKDPRPFYKSAKNNILNVPLDLTNQMLLKSYQLGEKNPENKIFLEEYAKLTINKDIKLVNNIPEETENFLRNKTRGIIAHNLKKFELATRYFELALENKQDFESTSYLGESLIRGQIQNAPQTKKTLEDSLNIQITNKGLQNLSFCCSALRLEEESLDYLEFKKNVCAIDPQDYVLSAQSLLNLQKYSEAKKELDKGEYYLYKYIAMQNRLNLLEIFPQLKEKNEETIKQAFFLKAQLEREKNEKYFFYINSLNNNNNINNSTILKVFFSESVEKFQDIETAKNILNTYFNQSPTDITIIHSMVSKISYLEKNYIKSINEALSSISTAPKSWAEHDKIDRLNSNLETIKRCVKEGNLEDGLIKILENTTKENLKEIINDFACCLLDGKELEYNNEEQIKRILKLINKQNSQNEPITQISKGQESEVFEINSAFSKNYFIIKTPIKNNTEPFYQKIVLNSFIYRTMKKIKNKIDNYKSETETTLDQLQEKMINKDLQFFDKVPRPICTIIHEKKIKYIEKKICDTTLKQEIEKEKQNINHTQKLMKNFPQYPKDVIIEKKEALQEFKNTSIINTLDTIAQMHAKTKKNIAFNHEGGIIYEIIKGEQKQLLIPCLNYLIQAKQRSIDGKPLDKNPRIGMNEYTQEFINAYASFFENHNDELFFLHGDLYKTNVSARGAIFDFNKATIGSATHDVSHFIEDPEFDDINREEIKNTYYKNLSNLLRQDKTQTQVEEMMDKIIGNYYKNKVHNLFCQIGAQAQQLNFTDAGKYTQKLITTLRETKEGQILLDPFVTYIKNTNNPELKKEIQEIL